MRAPPWRRPPLRETPDRRVRRHAPPHDPEAPPSGAQEGRGVDVADVPAVAGEGKAAGTVEKPARAAPALNAGPAVAVDACGVVANEASFPFVERNGGGISGAFLRRPRARPANPDGTGKGGTGAGHSSGDAKTAAWFPSPPGLAAASDRSGNPEARSGGAQPRGASIREGVGLKEKSSGGISVSFGGGLRRRASERDRSSVPDDDVLHVLGMMSNRSPGCRSDHRPERAVAHGIRSRRLPERRRAINRPWPPWRSRPAVPFPEEPAWEASRRGAIPEIARQSSARSTRQQKPQQNRHRRERDRG